MRKYVKLGCFSDDLLRRYVGWMDDPEGRRWYNHFYAHYQLRERAGLADGLFRIACPTAVIWGDRDPYCPFSTALKSIA